MAGVTHWDETNAGERGYAEAAQQMTAEVRAACEAATATGATEIVVKDAHDSARNITHAELPAGVRMFRGWSAHPWAMLEGLDDSYDAVFFTGYHSAASTGGSPLAHTMTTSLDKVTLNGMVCDELLLHTWLALYVGVKPILVTGDQALCQLAEERFPGMVTVPVKEGIGNGTISLHPDDAIRSIRNGVETALQELSERAEQLPGLPAEFRLEIRYQDQKDAYRNSFYPGCRLEDARTVVYETDDYGEVMRCAHFIM